MSRLELKELSKQQLNGKRGLLAGITLIFFILSIELSLITGVISTIIGILIPVFYLNFIRKDGEIRWINFKITIKSLVKILSIVLMMALILTPLIIIIFLIAGFLIYDGFILIFTILLITFIVAICLLSVYIFPITYLLIDNDELGIFEAIDKSIKIMNGNKIEYVKLMLSFTGWYIVAILSLGIGFLWVTPYYMVTVTNYYINIKSKYEQGELCEKLLEEM